MKNGFAWLRRVLLLEVHATEKFVMLVPLTFALFFGANRREGTFVSRAVRTSFKPGAGLKIGLTSKASHCRPAHAEARASAPNETDSRASRAAPPPTRRDSIVESIHGVRIPDPYRWLEDSESPETRAWTDAQNKYARYLLGALPRRHEVAQRLEALMDVDTVTTPYEEGGRYFFSKRRAGQELFVLYVRKGGKDEVLVDPHPLSADHSTSVGLEDVSPDGKLAIYSVRRGGEDEITLKLRDVDSRKDLPDELPRARYLSVSLKHDRSGFFYSRQRPEGSRVYYHALGTDASRDLKIFGDGYGPDKIVWTNISQDRAGRYLIIHVIYGAPGEKTEIYCQDLVKKGPILPVVKDTPARFVGEAAGNRLFLQTNWKAPKGRILIADLTRPGREREIVPESDAVIEGFNLAGGRLLVNYTHEVTSQLKIFEPDGKLVGEGALPALGTVSGETARWESKEAFFEFSSFHIPSTIYRYDLANDRQQLWAKTRAPVESDRLEVEQVWYESKDKTKVPMFLLHTKGLRPGRLAPALITGYGGFNTIETPRFSPLAVVWAEHGGVFAFPNLRGGGEFGEEWHRAGMLEKKQNVFDDFIAAAEWLMRRGFTTRAKLDILGRSDGGLLVGAALTQRPDLFRAAVCGYPLLDMLRYHKFLVARYWVPEYGSSEDPEQFKYLYSYSPYHHVRKGTRYPAVLFMTGDSDTRVDPLHARKMTALLQWATASAERPVLLHYDSNSGHSGGLPLNQQIQDMTDVITFLLWQLK